MIFNFLPFKDQIYYAQNSLKHGTVDRGTVSFFLLLLSSQNYARKSY